MNDRILLLGVILLIVVAAFSSVTANDAVIQQAYLKASNTGAKDRFGGAVAVDGDTMVIGASGEDSGASGVNGDDNDNGLNDSGAAYVFVRKGDTWIQQAYLKASNPNGEDLFGFSVAICQDTIVVGAIGESSNAIGVDGDESDNSMVYAGAAYVFVRTGDIWSQQAYLKASNPAPVNSFGVSVAISDETIVVGSENEDTGGEDSGAAYVFVRNEGAWRQQAYLKASDPHEHDLFGWSVAVDGDTAVVSAHLDRTRTSGVNGIRWSRDLDGSGAAYVFVRDGETWSEQAFLKASNPGFHNGFGVSVAIAGDTIVVGARSESSKATGVNGDQKNDPRECLENEDPFFECESSAIQSGAAYVFLRSDGRWTQQAYLKASNTDQGDNFGSSVAISGDLVVVGAGAESSGAREVDGDQDNENAASSGAAYLFHRSNGMWQQKAYLKASNADWGDSFGEAVAISAETVVVASIREASKATGVDGSQEDNSLEEAGAAYVFQATSPVPTFTEWLVTNGRSDPLADPVGYGLSNLLIYAFGADLIEPPNKAIPLISIINVEGNLVPTIRFRKRLGADLVYRIEISDTLEPGSWRLAEGEIEQMGDPIDHGDGTMTETFRAVGLNPQKTKAFLRIGATAP